MMEFKYLTVLASFEIIQTKKVICIPFYFSIILSNSTKISKYASLFQAGMGQFDHGYHTDSTKVGLGSPKLVTLFLSLFDVSQERHFWHINRGHLWGTFCSCDYSFRVILIKISENTPLYFTLWCWNHKLQFFSFLSYF